MDGSLLLLIAIGTVGFLMAVGIGANDVANAVGTSVGARVLTVMRAVVIAAIFETLGAILLGSEVTNTLQNDLWILPDDFDVDSLIRVMLAALMASGIWLLLASAKGWPVSTTHSIIGSLVGAGTVGLGSDMIQWTTLGMISISWLTSPLISGALAFILLKAIQRGIFRKSDPSWYAQRAIPWYTGMTVWPIAWLTLSVAARYFEMGLTLVWVHGLSFAGALLSVGMMKIWLWFSSKKPRKNLDFAHVEKSFAFLMIMTAAAMAFAHGANDVANAIAPLSAVVALVQNQPMSAPVPFWLLALGAVGIITGLLTYGHKVIATVGKNITALTPSRGFAAQLATALTVLSASSLGLPLSTTHTLVGAILGVGLARGIGALNVRVIIDIGVAWIITLPSGAILAIILFYLLGMF